MNRIKVKKKLYVTLKAYLHDFRFCLARLRSLGAERVLGVVAVRTHASSSSSSPVSYISESVVTQPRDDDTLLRLESKNISRKSITVFGGLVQNN